MEVVSLVDNSQERIRDRFNQMPWHDSKLLNVRIVPARHDPRSADVILEIILRSAKAGGEASQALLSLRDSTIVKLDFDIATKSVCGDDIASASCDIDSPLKSQLERERLAAEPNGLSGYLHFSWILCPPSGEMHVFARTFDIDVGVANG